MFTCPRPCRPPAASSRTRSRGLRGRRRLFLGAVTALAALAPAAKAADWRAVASQDLQAVHDLLRENAPWMAVTRDARPYRKWLEKGFAQAKSALPSVGTEDGYRSLLDWYAAGFRDYHIGVWPSDEDRKEKVSRSWPGFAVGWRNEDYLVMYRSTAATEAPPLGARLIGCDGRNVRTLAQARDLYDNNLRLESGRFFAAPYLFIDQGNPFVQRPADCAFKDGTEERRFGLRWRPMTDAEFASARAATTGRVARELSVTSYGKGWWIGIPSLADGQDWATFFDKVKSNLGGIRNAAYVVIDLRGDGGGDSFYADKLAAVLWGDKLVSARRPPFGRVVWRVSKANRDFWAAQVTRLEEDPLVSSADKTAVKNMLKRMDRAVAAGRKTFVEPGSAPGRSEPPPPNPVRGPVVLLTDHFCGSACLDLMDLFMAMPRTVQAGTQTNADTIFMELTELPLPSGHSMLGFGHKAWIDRPRPSNQPYVPRPALTWRGPPSDDAAERAWLVSKLQAEGLQRGNF